MRNKKLFLCLVLLISSIVISCKWQVPEKVSVKSNAAYELKAGRFEKSLNDEFDVTKLVGSNLPKGMEVYDYFPGEKNPDLQRYLLKVPLADIPFDLSEMLEGIDLTGGLDAMKFEKSIEIPTITMPEMVVPVPMEDLAKDINKLLIGGGIVCSGPEELYPTKVLEQQGITIGSITYSSGSLVIEGADLSSLGFNVAIKNPITNQPIAPGTELIDNTSITVDFGNGVSKKATVSGNKAVIDLKGVTVDTKNTKYSFDKQDPITFKATVSSDATIAKVTGLTIKEKGTPRTLVLPVSFDLPDVLSSNNGNNPVKIKNVTVGSGSLGIAVSGLEKQPTIDLSITGGLKLGGTGSASVSNGEVTLADATFTSGASKGTANVTLTLNNMEIDFANLKVKVTPVIESLKTVTADLGLGDGLKFNKTMPLPGEVTKMVKTIGLNPSGIEITYTNGLPAGNNITLKAKSDFLQINNGTSGTFKEVSLEAGKPGLTAELKSGKCDINITEGSTVDFDVEIGLPGAGKTPETASYVTLKNITAGAKYNIAMELKPVIDWENVTVDTANFNIPESSMDLNLNLYEMMSGVKEALGGTDLTGITIGDLPIYLYCTKPDLAVLNNLAFNGTVKLFFGEGKKDTNGDGVIDENDTNSDTPAQKPDTKEVYILGSNDGSKDIPGDLNLVSNVPELTKKGTVVVGDLSNTEASLKTDPTLMSEFIPALMTTDGSLCMKYGVGINGGDNGITIAKKDLEDLKNNGKSVKIAIEAYIDLGLELNVNKDIKVSASKLMGLEANKDLTNGKLAELKGNKTVEEAAGLIKKLSVDYSIDALPCELAKNQDLKLNVNIAGLDPINIDLIKGKSIDIYGSQLKTLLGMEKPALIINDLSVTLPQGTIKVPRAKDIKASLGVSFALDGNNSVTIAEIKDKNGGKPKFDGNWDITVAGKNLNELNNGGNK